MKASGKRYQTILVVMLMCILQGQAVAQTREPGYHYRVNTGNLVNDRLEVQLDFSGLSEDTVLFCFPKIVPGIYGTMDFGQYITAFRAFDRKGRALPVWQEGVNCWGIAGAAKLSGLSYLVDDSWEVFDFDTRTVMYRSAASSFTDSVQVINANCLFGYFEGYADRKVEVQVDKKINLYPATSLQKTVGENSDHFIARDYHELVDNPILYAKADTTLLHLPGIEVEVACYSASGQPISKAIAGHIRPLLLHQTEYLDNKLPVDRYTFIIYHNPNSEGNHFMGDGLEHSGSTLILLYVPLDMEWIKHNVYGIASHEFFHTLMPLGIHSHEIQDYDYNHPQFSQHLWLYEGMTEYFTMHMPVKTGLQEERDFFNSIERKLEQMKEFDPLLPLTELSIHCTERQDQYYNVYLKGALVNLCLDIRLRELSEGRYGVKDLVLGLMERYGPERPFEDGKLFDEMVAMTGYPEVGDFVEKYIRGIESLPLEEMLLKAGLVLENGKIREADSVSEEQQKLRSNWLH